VPVDGLNHREESGNEGRSARTQRRAQEKLPAARQTEGNLATGTRTASIMLPGNAGIKKPNSYRWISGNGLKINPARGAQSSKAKTFQIVTLRIALSVGSCERQCGFPGIDHARVCARRSREPQKQP
jgi:hypothetical protein